MCGMNPKRHLRRPLFCGLRRTLLCGSSSFLQCPYDRISNGVCSDNLVATLFQKFQYCKRRQLDRVIVGEPVRRSH